MNRNFIGMFIAAIVYIAILYMLVRPGSSGPNIITTISNTLSDLVRGTVGYTYDAGTGEWSSP